MPRLWSDVAAAGYPQTVASFQAAIADCLVYLFHLNDYTNQINYLNTAPKPFALSCLDLSSGLQFMNCMLGLIPGAPNPSLLTVTDLKHTFYCMMLPNWQCSFIWCGHDINDVNLALLDLPHNIQELKDDDTKHVLNVLTRLPILLMAHLMVAAMVTYVGWMWHWL